MAQEYKNGSDFKVPFGQIYWFHKRNERDGSSYGGDTQRALVLQRFRDCNGWKSGEYIPVLKMSKEDQVLAVKELTEEYAKLQLATDADAGINVRLFRLLHVNGKDKINPPDWEADGGFRRSLEFPKYLSERLRELVKENPAATVETDICVTLTSYATPDERIVGQQMHNAVRDAAYDLTIENKLKVVYKLVTQYGYIEQRIIPLYGKNNAQRLHGACDIDKAMPSVNFVNRFLLDPKDPNCLNLRKFSHVPINQWTGRIKADEKRAKGKTLTKKELEFSPITPEILETEITAIMKGGSSADKIMNKKTIEGVKGMANGVVSFVAEQILDNNAAKLVELNESAQSHNLVMELNKDNKNPIVESLLRMVKEDPVTMKIIADMGVEGIKNLIKGK